jgi:hypothetical protein
MEIYKEAFDYLSEINSDRADEGQADCSLWVQTDVVDGQEIIVNYDNPCRDDDRIFYDFGVNHYGCFSLDPSDDKGYIWTP